MEGYKDRLTLKMMTHLKMIEIRTHLRAQGSQLELPRGAMPASHTTTQERLTSVDNLVLDATAKHIGQTTCRALEAGATQMILRTICSVISLKSARAFSAHEAQVRTPPGSWWQR